MSLVSQATQAAQRRELNESDDPRRLWKELRETQRRLDTALLAISTLTTKVTAIKRLNGGVLSGLHPFKIYQLPPRLRPAGPNPDGLDWRRVRVRKGNYQMFQVGPYSGFVFDSPFAGIAGTDAVFNPDIETYLDNPMATDILIPEETTWYFWLHFDGEGAAEIRYGNGPGDPTPGANAGDAQDWPEFPDLDIGDGSIRAINAVTNDESLVVPDILIGWCDSTTLVLNNQLVIRQILRDDPIVPYRTGCHAAYYGVWSVFNFYPTNAIVVYGPSTWICSNVGGNSFGILAGGNPPDSNAAWTKLGTP
jgi:hypothetical protein